jgi:hypothetical protein
MTSSFHEIRKYAYSTFAPPWPFDFASAQARSAWSALNLKALAQITKLQ